MKPTQVHTANQRQCQEGNFGYNAFTIIYNSITLIINKVFHHVSDPTVKNCKEKKIKLW